MPLHKSNLVHCKAVGSYVLVFCKAKKGDSLNEFRFLVGFVLRRRWSDVAG